LKVAAENVYTDQLATFGEKVTNQVVADAGLVSSAFVRVKLLTRGEVAGKHDIQLQGASATAVEAVEKAGGSFKKVPRQMREPKPKAE